MNAFVICTALLALVLSSALGGDDKLNEKIQKAFAKCKEKHNPPAAELEAMKKKDLEYAYSKDSKCLIACMMEEGKVMVGGIYNKENALIMSDVMHKDNAEDAAKAREVIEACVKDHPSAGSDKCEFAYEMTICAGKEANRLGMKDVPDFFH